MAFRCSSGRISESLSVFVKGADQCRSDFTRLSGVSPERGRFSRPRSAGCAVSRRRKTRLRRRRRRKNRLIQLVQEREDMSPAERGRHGEQVVVTRGATLTFAPIHIYGFKQPLLQRS